VTRSIEIVPGDMGDYRKLACYHYRGTKLTAYAGVFAMRFGNETVGVIVYTMPSMGLELRNVATGGFFCGLDRATRLSLINRNIRCIGRVVIEPRFCGLGLAVRLVRETMPKMGFGIIEAAAVMGLVNPFFERAGMTAYRAPMPARCVRMLEAFSLVGIEEKELAEPQEVHRKVGRLGKQQRRFIEHQIRGFLQSYGKSRNIKPGPERTRFVLSKLTERPVYYIWFNKQIAFSV
jgi:hypothetical protein